MKIKILLLVLFLLFINSSFAKSISEIKGRITNSVTGEPIFNVNIFLKGTFIGTTSDENGYYSFKVPVGKHTLQLYHIVYKRKEIEIDIKPDSVYVINIKMEEIVLQLGTVSVNGKREIAASNYVINEASIKNMPALVEPDVMRTVSFLPGIVQYSDYNVELNIRGGWSDQNKIIYDDVEVYNPYHLLGIFSAFNLWTIDDVQVWTANFPAQHSGKLSGIVLMKSKTPTTKPFTKLNVSLIMANLTLTRKYGNTFFMLGVRRPYLDLIMALMGKTDMLIRMYDLNFKVNHKFSNNFSTDFIAFVSNEGGTTKSDKKNNIPESNGDYGNRVAALKLNYRNHKLMFSFCRNLMDGNDGSTSIHNHLDDFNVKYSNKLSFDKHQHSFGTTYQSLSAVYDWNINTSDDGHIFGGNVPSSFLKSSLLKNYSFWLDSKVYPVNTIQLGAKSTLYYNNNSGNFYYSPGISFEWNPSSTIRFTLSAERNHQFTVTGLSTGTNFVVAGNPIYTLTKPISANIYNIGSKLNLGLGYNLSTELYYKQFDRIVKLSDDLKNYPNFIDGSGTAYGLELFFEKVTGRITYQINYSYLKTSYKIQNKNFNPRWNLPHTVKGLMGVTLGKTWKFNLSAIYRSGALYNKAIGYYKAVGEFDPYLESDKYNIGFLSDHIIFDKRKFRFDPYWRFDVSLRKKYSNKYFDWDLYIQVQNITFNSNAIEVYSKQYASDIIRVGRTQDAAYLPGLPILPSVGVEFTF